MTHWMDLKLSRPRAAYQAWFLTTATYLAAMAALAAAGLPASTFKVAAAV